MNKIRHEKYGTFGEMAVKAKVLRNAYEDLSFEELGTSGRLCDEIAKLGYAQAMTIDSLFYTKSRTVLEQRLAGRVCESCIFWKDCDRLAIGDAPIDELDRFSIAWNTEVASDLVLTAPATTTLRNEQIALPSRYRLK